MFLLMLVFLLIKGPVVESVVLLYPTLACLLVSLIMMRVLCLLVDLLWLRLLVFLLSLMVLLFPLALP